MESTLLKFVKIGFNVLLITLFLGYSLNRIELPVLRHLDQAAYDLRLRANLPENTDSSDIVIIDIDEKSLAVEGRWPWSRNRMAQLVDRLFNDYAIDLLGFDVIFAEAETDERMPSAVCDTASSRQINAAQTADQTLATSFRHKAVVLSFFTDATLTTANAQQLLSKPWLRVRDEKLLAFIPRALSVGANLDLLQTAAADAGFFNNPLVDQDGVFRRLPLLSRFDDAIYPALSLALYRQYLQTTQFALISSDLGGQGMLEGLSLGKQLINTAADSSILVGYQGKQHSFTYYSASDILKGIVDKQVLRHKIVLVGSTAAGLMDLRSTPVQNVFPGVEIHATILNNLIHHQIKYKPYYWQIFEAGEMLLIVFLSLIYFTRTTALWNSARFIVLGFAIIALNYYLWHYANIDSLLAAPLLLLLLLFINQFTFAYYLELLRKRGLSQLFGLYVPEPLVRQMVKSGKRFELAGESRNMSVFFSDVWGFTELAENLTANQLSALLNSLLSPITEIIHAHQGTIDKYIGDAVMAFWGAPLTDEKHASHAVAAALSIVEKLTEINQQFKAKGWPEIKLGLGINSGKMSVGNMGSSFRMAYTVLGDAVNVAARLENLCRYYHAPLIVGESTRQLASEFAFRELDKIRVKGRVEPITIYQPLGYLAQTQAPRLLRLQLEQQMLQHYRLQHWSQAEALLRQLQATQPDDFFYQLYLQRIAEFRVNPPATDWQGVYLHLEK